MNSLERFGVAEHGVRWALSTLPETQLDVRLAEFAGAEGPDDWSLKFSKGGVVVASNSAVGTISAALELARMLRAGVKKHITRNLRFRTRNYKHEAHFGDDPRSVTSFPIENWEKLCREIVSRQFNGLVLYADYHPFQHVLDYKEFPCAVKTTPEARERNRAAFNRMLRVAHQYGLTTFLQHYIGHFTEEFAAHVGLTETPSGRLSGVDHPEADRYCSWCYREIYRALPDLDGLYFNFESSPDSYDHVLRNAMPHFAKMAKKPACVFRLWNASSIEGIRSLVRAVQGYGGRAILSHKVSDTSDTYHYPVCDSRVLEWKKAIPEAEFMFCLGPCHNCGTNLCEQLWADYDFVQKLVGDVAKKGADSIGFHSASELLAEDAGGDFWPERERTLSRWNILHLESAVDFVNGRVTPRPERARKMAERLGGSPAVGTVPLSGTVPSCCSNNRRAQSLQAGKTALDLLESTSAIIIATFQQFYHSAAWEGFLNPGRDSHIRDPYYFYPSNGINNTRKLNIWTAPLGEWCWITKTIPVKVASDDEFEYIIDYVNPVRKRKARRHPKRIADELGRSVEKSFAALAKLRKQGLAAEADGIEKYVRANALVGEYTRAEILAAIRLYSLYFAKTKPAMLKALREGVKLLEPLPAMLARGEFARKSMDRAIFWDWFGAENELARAKKLLALVESTEFPLDPFRRYVASHVHYNNVRRICRAYHNQNAETLRYAAGQIRIARKHARSALVRAKDSAFAANMQRWVDYLDLELARMTPPKAVCPRLPADAWRGSDPPRWNTLFHDDCFRMGEHFTEDFSGFFEPIDYERRSGITFAMWSTGKELAISWREEGIDLAQREARWAKYRGSGSDAFVMRAFIDAGDGLKKLTVFPKGEKVALGMRFVDARTEYASDATSWRTTVYLPFDLLGRTPKPGETWRMNVSSNPFVARNLQYTWSPQYDGSINPGLFGSVTFE